VQDEGHGTRTSVTDLGYTDRPKVARPDSHQGSRGVHLLTSV